MAEHLTFNQGVWSSNLQWVIPICLLISPLVRAWRNGRRARLRIWCLWRKSSSLFARTNFLRTMQSRGYAVVAQLVERHLAKVEVASPSLVYRSTCGCSSMVELQPSKLVTWVRFPSPAPAQRVLFMGSPQETVRKGGFCLSGFSAYVEAYPQSVFAAHFWGYPCLTFALQRVSPLRRRPEGFAVALWTASHCTPMFLDCYCCKGYRACGRDQGAFRSPFGDLRSPPIFIVRY